MASCFDPPEFPNVPEIEFNRIEFYDGDATDSLVLFLNFKDGDGDLGLNSGLLQHISAPYHNTNYYQAVGNGQIRPLSTLARTVDIRNGRNEIIRTDIINILDVPSPSSGKLVFPRTRKQAGYSFLPVYNDCPDYEYLEDTNLYIEESDWGVVDGLVTPTDTLFGINSSGPPTRFIEILDTLYLTVNPNHFNIEVDFLIKDPSSTTPEHPGWRLYDWRRERCLTFDGRFPVLSETSTALEGTIRYSMNSLGFVPIFGLNKTLKLRVQIKDRALNTSQWIETREFTLDQI